MFLLFRVINFLLFFILVILEVYNNEGDDEVRQKNFYNVIYFYMEGIKVNFKDDELRVRLYGNRVIVYFYLGQKL